MENTMKKYGLLLLTIFLLQNSFYISAQSPSDKTLSQEKKRLVEKIAKSWEKHQKTQPNRYYYSEKNSNKQQEKYVAKVMGKIAKLARSRYQTLTKFDSYENAIVDVAINNDGTFRKANLIKSSGVKAIDDFILKTVKDSAPFDAFEKNIFDAEIVHIARSMGFKSKKTVQN